MSNAMRELECWAEGRDADYAHVFTELTKPGTRSHGETEVARQIQPADPHEE